MTEAGAQKRWVHGLIDKSRDRVTHVRAGFSLLSTLHSDGIDDDNADGGSPTEEGTRDHKQRHHVDGNGTSSMPVLPVVENKSSMYVRDRRKAVTKVSPKVIKLGKQNAPAAAAPAAAAPKESPHNKLMRTVAIVRGQHAFTNKDKYVEPPWKSIQNSHLAFTEFQKEPTAIKGATSTITISQANRRQHTTLCFGDRVCLISSTSNLPLAMNPDGRCSQTAQTTITGPHMMFTLVDFRNQTRTDEVTVADDFRLQIDRDFLAHSDEDIITAFLTDTQFYLGCPGSFDDSESGKRKLPFVLPPPTPVSPTPIVRKKRKNTECFKLMAIKASIPSREFYVDDEATRECAVESNDFAMHLARWQFTKKPAAPAARLPSLNGIPHAVSTSALAKEIDSDVLLNCDHIYVGMNEMWLDYDGDLQRAVMRSAPSPAEAVCSWQVRLLHKTNAPQEQHHSPIEKVGEASHPSNEWLRQKQQTIEKHDEFIRHKRYVVEKARAAYEQVAQRNNRRLAEMQSNKAHNERAYFEALSADLLTRPPPTAGLH